MYIYKTLDWTLLSDFMLCPKRLFFRQQELRGKEQAFNSRPALFGIAWHKVMELLYNQLQRTGQVPPDLIGDYIHKSLLEQLLPSSEFDEKVQSGSSMRANPYHRDKLPPLLEKYLAGVKEWLEGVEVLGTEECVSDKELRYSARIDLIVRKDGLVYFIDHKTSRYEVGPVMLEHYLYSHGQMSGQLALGKAAYGDEFGECIIHAINISSGSFQFIDVPFNRDRVDRFKAELGWQLMQLEGCQTRSPVPEQTWPENYTACNYYQRACPYWEACWSGNKSSYSKDLWLPGLGW